MSHVINSTPSMDPGGFDCFKEKLAASACFLEYGSGGSTVYACTVAKIKNVISVESDPAWVEKVRAMLQGSPSNLLIRHCDIGEVGDWGTPKNTLKFHHFWRYMVTPWDVAKKYGHVPDTVLIDGRFRVASFLYSLISAPPGTTILFDDYVDRPRYARVEEFCRLKESRGRMGVFTVTHQYSPPDLIARIAEYSVIMD